jgi:hypothetical protein
VERKWTNTRLYKPFVLLISFNDSFSANWCLWLTTWKDVEVAGRGIYFPTVQTLPRKDWGKPRETCRDSWPHTENLNWDLWNRKQRLTPHILWLSCAKRITEAVSVWNPWSLQSFHSDQISDTEIRTAHRIWNWKKS